ncbi:MAG: OadG family protein [Deltaproteobacteria bacterium]|nr:OadG family protein [Deltaproteobacteria bacterium]
MTTTELLAKFADPEIIQTLSLSDKLFAGLMATILGMGITFISLIVLQFAMVLMEKMLGRPAKQSVQKALHSSPPAPSPEVTGADDNELIAVISSVIALQLKTSVNNIVIRNIEKIEDSSSAWNRTGRLEQMNSRL